ncbi:MAG: ABC transporter permease subunit [Lachnospiraceae bacterium]|nr:ABC transporter permease subunit [Lachnospiraceae bacterium]
MVIKILKNPQAVIGLILVILILFVALFAPAIAPNDPEQVDIMLKFGSPSSQYPFGNDALGRCIFSRLLYGARYSMAVSLPILILLSAIGMFLGTLSVCAGRKLNAVLDYICDTFIALPQLVVGIAIIGMLGTGFKNIIITIIISMWAWFTKMVRAYSQVEMSKDYILAARISGCGMLKLIFKHLIPNIMPQFLVFFSTGIATSILMVSTFAFLGLGLPAGTPEWGAMLKDASTHIYNHPEMLVYPGVCILVTSAGFVLFGEAVRDILMSGEDAI